MPLSSSRPPVCWAEALGGDTQDSPGNSGKGKGRHNQDMVGVEALVVETGARDEEEAHA